MQQGLEVEASEVQGVLQEQREGAGVVLEWKLVTEWEEASRSAWELLSELGSAPSGV